MSGVSPFRITPDDLSSLDGKTRNGLEPLLDGLNVTLQQVAQSINAQPTERTYNTTFVSEASGSAYVSFAPPVTKPTSVHVDQICLTDGSDMASVFSWSWVMNGTQVRMLFVGLDMSAKYNLRVTIK